MLQFVEGTSGSGKTDTIRHMLMEKAKTGEEKLLLLVPEQNSFENERAMLRLMGPKEAGRITVTSFTRMVDLVMRQTGGLAGRRLNDSGRSILMSLALSQVKEELVLYQKQSGSRELVELMLSALKEFKMCGIRPEDLKAAADRLEEGNLRKKIRETGLVMAAYEALVSQSYIDPLDDLTRLKNVLEVTPFFKGYTVMVDAFAGFTAQELEVLSLVLRQAKETVISVCVDQDPAKDNGMGLFSPVKKTVRQLRRIAKDYHIPLASPIRLPHGKRFQNEELKLLEQVIYRQERLESGEVPGHIVLYNASDIYEEADFVARRIQKLVQEEGYRYREITVIARETESYRGVLDAALESYGIPYFMDQPEPLEEKPLMTLVLSALECVQSGYRSDELFRLLKTGLTELQTEEIAALENYALLWNLSGRRWLEPFTMHPRGFSPEMTEEDQKKLEGLNRLRETVMEPLAQFEESLRSGTGKGIAYGVYQLLERLNAAQNIRRMADELENMGEWNLAQEQIRLWDMLMEILDQMALVLKEQHLSPRRWSELFQLVVQSEEIAFIPQGVDEVSVGGADRSRPAAPRAVFLIGAEEGEFPRTPVSAGVFSDAERRLMISMGLPLYDSLEKLAVEERYLAYMAAVSPSERLFVSYASSDLSGGARSPSSLVREVRKIFPECPVADRSQEAFSDLLWSPEPAFELAASLWREPSEREETLKRYFGGLPEYQDRLEAVGRAASEEPIAFQNPENAQKLFGSNLRVSASQIEKYYLCRFQYFCRYGLGAKERKPAVFDALEYGSVMHYLLENMLRAFSGEALASMKKQELLAEIRRLLDSYVETNLGGWEEKSPRFRYLLARLADTAQMLLSHLGKELAQSDFVPADFELSIGKGKELEPLVLEIPGGGQISVEGKIDRVDVMEKPSGKYIRVVDYKTGSKDFKLSDVLYGLNMQMLLYLDTVWKNGKSRYGSVLPAGILYVPAARPSVSAQWGDSGEKLEKERDKKLRMNGLVLDDPEVITGMEKQAQGVFIPVALKNGEPAKLDSVANLAQLGALTKKMEKLVVDMACSLRQGGVDAEPAAGEYDACAYCPYGPVCGHEPEGRSRLVEKLDRNQVMAAVQEEAQEKEEAYEQTKLD